MKKFVISAIGLVFVSAVLSVSAHAQSACPTLAITNVPAGSAADDLTLVMTRLQNADATKKPVYKWTASAGKIEPGSAVKSLAFLSAKDVAIGTRINISVEADGFGCKVAASTWVTITQLTPFASQPTSTPSAVTAGATTAACPSVSVIGPSQDVKAGGSLIFTASVSGGSNGRPTYNWTVSAGTISSGQGTALIDMDTNYIGGHQSITATVEVGGFDRSCPYVSASATASIRPNVQSRKFDEFGAMVNTEDQYARLDNAAIEMQNDPTAGAVLIFYAGRKSRMGAIEALTDQTKKYLTDTRGIAEDRIQTLNGGFREMGLIELWLVPAGAEVPAAMPTVDPSEAQQLPPLKTTPAKKPGRKKP